MEIPAFLKKRGITCLVAGDFETYYGKDYSLRKKGTSITGYIRDERFKAHGLAICTDRKNKPVWVPHNKIKATLARIRWDRTAFLAHHCQFDGLILNHHFGVVPAYYLCTLSMARPLHGGEIGNSLDEVAQYYGKGNKLPDVLNQMKDKRDLTPAESQALGEYACEDVRLMCEVFMAMLPRYPEAELDLIHHTIRAYCEPVIQINTDLAREEHTREVERKRALILATGRKGDTFDGLSERLRSREQFASLLRSLGVNPPMKISSANGHPTYAFAKGDLAFQELAHHPNKKVRALYEAKLAASSSLHETRALRLIEHACPAFPVYLKYGAAHTFRWSGGDLVNAQNLPDPVRSKTGSRLRECLEAPKGYKFVVVDSGQIEARTNFCLAGQDDAVEAFRRGDDLYSDFSGEVIYKRPITKANKLERLIGKICILALGYQMGVDKFRYTLEAGVMGPPVKLTPVELYAKAVYGFRNRFPKVPALWRFLQERALLAMYGVIDPITFGPLTFKKEAVVLPNGMELRYPNLRPRKVERREGNKRWAKNTDARVVYDDWRYNDDTKIYGGLLDENVVQALARIVVAEQILTIAERWRVVLMVHDEVVLCVKNAYAKRALKETLEAFHTPPTWMPNLPTVGEGVISSVYQKA